MPGSIEKAIPAANGRSLPADDVGLLVHRKPDAVAGAVHEKLRQPGLGQHLAGGGVDLLGGYPRTDRVERRPLGSLQYRILLRDIVLRLADAVGARRVGVVSGLVGAPDVDDDDVTGLQFAIRIAVVRVGAVRAGADDDEGHLRVPFGDNGFGDIGGDVGLGAARNRNSGTRACTRSIAEPALRSASISHSSLTIRSVRSTSVASTGSTPSTRPAATRAAPASNR